MHETHPGVQVIFSVVLNQIKIMRDIGDEVSDFV